MAEAAQWTISDEPHKIKAIEQAPGGRILIQQAEIEMGSLMVRATPPAATTPHHSAAFFLQAFRRRWSKQMPLEGCRITVACHLDPAAAVLAETFAACGASVRCCGCNTFSTNDAVAAALAEAGTAAVFGCRQQGLEQHWWCILQALSFPGGEGPVSALIALSPAARCRHTDCAPATAAK